MSYKVYASEEYVKENSVSKNQGINNIGKILGIDKQGKVTPLNYLSGIVFKDATTEIDYIGYVDNGEWTLIKKIDRIEIIPSSKTTYLKGEEISLNGITVNAIFSDNSVIEIDNYTYERNEISENEIEFIISYEQLGFIYKNSFKVTIIDLIDFYYNIDENYNYIITGWKETYNGQPSKTCVFPNNENIIIDLS
jgi:hypothetical protein